MKERRSKDRRTGLDRRRYFNIETNSGDVILGYGAVGMICFLWGAFWREVIEWIR